MDYYLNPEKILPVSERTLDLAVEVFNLSSDKNLKFKAECVIVDYILYNTIQNGRESTSIEEINSKYGAIIADSCLNKLSNIGFLNTLVSQNGEIEYSLTRCGLIEASKIQKPENNLQLILKRFMEKYIK